MLMKLCLSVCSLSRIAGHDASSSPEILNWATEYVKIRAFSMPTSLLLGVLQACLLGAKDSVTPLIAVVYAMVVNVVGDYIGVTYLGQGLKGAAIATTLAQWASTWALMGPARKKLVIDHDLGLTSNKHRMKKNKSVSGAATDDDGAVTAKAFLKFAVPVLTLIVGKLAAFGFMTHAAAGLSGQPTTLAAHQIILSTFFFISPFLEVISQTAQTFLPPYVTPVREYVARRMKTDASYDVKTDALAQSWLAAAFTVATRLLGIGIVVASVIASIVSLIPAFFGNFITSDVVVQKAVKPLAKYLWAGAFLTAPVAVSEGVLLARRELPFLASVYVVSTIVLPFALIEIKRQSGPVVHVWGCFAAFQLFRASCFASKIWGKPLLNAASNMLRGKKQVAAPIEPPEPQPETVVPAIS
jgi:Na+-driven multidrug efflux pump